MKEHLRKHPMEVLLVEDSPGDVRLTREAFKEAQVSNHLEVVADGVKALAYLHREGEYAKAPRPDIILLDLNLPKKNGRQVLAEIKEDPDLRRIPVVVLTTSQSEDDIAKSYDLHANCFISKPMNLEKFVEIIKSIERFWLSIVQLPEG